MEKNNKKSDKAFNKLSKLTVKELTKKKPSYLVAEGDESILMPMQTALMRAGLSKIQLNVVLAVLAKLKGKLSEILWNVLHGYHYDLFAEQEAAGDPRPIKIKILFKDFGIAPKHYPQLESAMKAMATIPVGIPVRGALTKIEYTKVTNLFTVYIPTDPHYMRYCIVSMEKDVAEHFMRFDLGYYYVGKLTSWKMSSKYSERLYWYIKANLNHGGVTVSMDEFRKMLGVENMFDRFSMFEKKILAASASEIKALFDKGECECWFEYEKIYNDDKKNNSKNHRGYPDAIKFKIHPDNKPKALEKISMAINTGVFEEIRDTMRKDLSMSEYFVGKYMAMVNEENKERFLSKLISLKIQLDQKESDKQPPKNRIAYIVKSLNNFFTEDKAAASQGNSAKSSVQPSDKHSNLSYRDRWAEVLQKLAQYLSEQDMDDFFGNVRFGSFDADNGKLLLNVTSRDVCAKIENSERVFKLLETFLREYYNFKQFNWLVVKKKK